MGPLLNEPYSVSGRPRVVIVGAGAIGLSTARELCRDGFSVTVLDKGEPGAEASSAAAGMIAPSVELEPHSRLWELGQESRALFPQLAAELEEETGLSVDLRLNGLLVPVFRAGDEPARDPVGAIKLSARDAFAIEPSLAPSLQRAILYETEGSVDNRALVAALAASARARGASIVPGVRVEEVLTAGGRVCGVKTGSGTLPADVVINCAGAWAGQIRIDGAALSVKPVKGHMLSVDAGVLDERSRPRRVLYLHTTYVVPRSDGRVILGTTVEDRGFDRTVEAGALSLLIEKARAVWPAVSSARFVEAWTGLRPQGSGEEPTIAALGPEGYFVAVGHYRNGILLTPITARILGRLVQGNRDSSSTPDGRPARTQTPRQAGGGRP